MLSCPRGKGWGCRRSLTEVCSENRLKSRISSGSFLSVESLASSSCRTTSRLWALSFSVTGFAGYGRGPGGLPANPRAGNPNDRCHTPTNPA